LPERTSQQRKLLTIPFANAEDHPMRDFRDAKARDIKARDVKAMAHTLREALKSKSVSLTHSESLELIAKTLGFHDWNVLAARIQAGQPTVTGAGTSVPAAALPSMSAGAGVPIVPIRDIVLFPQMIMPIFVGRDKTRRAVDSAMARNCPVLVVAQRRPADDDPTLDDLYPVGLTANVINRQTQADGVLKVFVSGVERAAIVRLIRDEFLTAEIELIEERRGQSAEAVALSNDVLNAYQSYANVDFSPSPQRPRSGLPSIGNPSLLADTVAPLLSIGIENKQKLLETSDVVTRLEMIRDLMQAARPAA
jgi:Lon protease-like protein